MIRTMKHLHRTLLAILIVCGLVSSCKEDESVPADGYGYVQFDVAARGTRAGEKLEHLSSAKKIRVVMTHDGRTFSQTLPLRAFNESNAELGQQSDKLKLAKGRYALTGFYLYNQMDSAIYASGGEEIAFDIVGAGLHVQHLDIDAVVRGMVQFDLVKQFVETRADNSDYAFSSIKGVSFTVRNVFTQERHHINNVTVTHVKTRDEDETGHNITSSIAECDTTVWLPVGTYQVIDYTTYSDKKCRYILGVGQEKNAPAFVVKANEKTSEAQVPILLSKASERLKDYAALKAIWDALDGPHWKYIGQVETAGCNWDFDKDLDLWGEQPGVTLQSDGRVSVLSLLGFGVRGVVPDAIGQLTQLRVLYLGSHDETVGGMTAKDINEWNNPERKEAQRSSYENMFLCGDARQNLSEAFQKSINNDPKQRPIVNSRIDLKNVQTGYMTNQITGISRAVMRLTELQLFYIANSPITTEGFFRDIEPDSPFYGEELDWGKFKSLTDVEIYNCPKLTALPTEMLAPLPELQLLNVANNYGISGTQLKADWEALINGKSGGMLQILYMGNNNLEETPSHADLKRMYKLSCLDLSNNKLHTVHPFGKGVNIVKLFLDHNKITEIPADENGFFSNYSDVETMSFSFNQLTEVPDIFNAKSVYTIESVDFSHNNIKRLQHGEEFKGINASTVNLSYNPFDEFPARIFKAGSAISYLLLAGCGLKEIPEGAMTGDKSFYLTSVDLSYNRLKALPTDFYATNMPYLFGLDISGNQFSEIPYQPLDCYTLTVLIARRQRDDAGNRTLRTWLTGIYQHPSLTAYYLGGNDLRKIEDTISPNIYIFEIKDNPNISIDLSGVCAYIAAGYYQLVYDKTQDIRGCSYLDLE